MAFPDRRTMSVLLTTLLFAVALAIVYIARAVIVIFAFSILFAYLINPIVRFLQRHSLLFKNLRGPHVAEAYLALLIFIALIAHVLAPGYLGRSSKLIQQIPVWSDRFATGEIATDMGSKYGWSDTQTRRLRTFLVQHRSDIQNATGATQRFATVVIGAVVVIPILGIFFLSDGENLANQGTAEFQMRGELAKRSLPVFKQMHAAGVPVMAGTDTTAPNVFPGFARLPLS